MKPEATIILGPTASGKTDYAITLAQQRPSVIISADSRQVYTGMNIGTAKPQDAWSDKAHNALTPDSVQEVDHYLFNVRTPNNPLTLADWHVYANEVLDLVSSRGLHPIIVGGTMLYVDSILYNYSLPQVPPNESLRASLEKETAEHLYARLQQEDPSATAFIEPHNKRRIIRALEVIEATGQPFSQARAQRPSRFDFTVIGLFPGWETLQERITQRHRGMFEHGLLAETKHLQDQYDPSLPLLQTMNYRQAATVLNQTVSLEDAVIENIRVNMRYARRQMSWWRGRNDIRWLEK